MAVWVQVTINIVNVILSPVTAYIFVVILMNMCAVMSFYKTFVHVKTAYCFHRLAYLGLKIFPKINIICGLEHVDARF